MDTNNDSKLKQNDDVDNFHFKCGEIYYLQSIDEVIIICNICNSENFDNYNNFYEHFRICSTSIEKNQGKLGIEEFLKSEVLDISDIMNEAESNTDTIENFIDNPVNQSIIPIIEVTDSDSESTEKYREHFQSANESVEDENLIINHTEQTDEIITNTTTMNIDKFQVKTEPNIDLDSNIMSQTLKSNLEEEIKKIINNPTNNSLNIESKCFSVIDSFRENETSSNKIDWGTKKYDKKFRPFECDECGRSFTQQINLTVHKRKHTGEKPYKCDLCENTYRQKSNLDAHKLKHAGIKPYSCDVCAKNFYQVSQLIAHERIHSGIRPYNCKYCTKSFAQSSQLNSHSRLHTGEKPYQCSYCSKKCTQQRQLQLHEYHHTKGATEYKCKKCDYAYFSPHFLKKHVCEGSINSNDSIEIKPLDIKKESDEKLECGDCGKRFNVIERLNSHYRKEHS